MKIKISGLPDNQVRGDGMCTAGGHPPAVGPAVRGHHCGPHEGSPGPEPHLLPLAGWLVIILFVFQKCHSIILFLFHGTWQKGKSSNCYLLKNKFML